MPEYYGGDENIPEDDDPVDEPEEELCEDLSCTTCYPEQNSELEGAPWYTAWANTSSFSEIFPVEQEGEEMPETPEVIPEENPEENPENVGRIRPVPVPSITGVRFSNRNGESIRANRRFNTVDNGDTVQISFWDISPESVRDSFQALKEWLVANEFHISGVSKDYFSDENDFQGNIVYYFSVWNPETNGSLDPLTILSQPPCGCGEELDYPTFKCPSCEELVYCSACRDFTARSIFDETWGAYCDRCGGQCTDCDGEFHVNWRSCPDCFPRVNCRGCSRTLFIDREEIRTHEVEGATYSYCVSCYEGICHSCGMVVDPEQIIEDEGHSCINCVSRNNNEEWDESSVDNLLIPTIPGREVIRLVGVEIEGANGEGLNGRDGGNTLARALYDAGLSGSYAMNGYHSGNQSKVYVERDSSVDWEMVVGPLNVANPLDVDLLNSSVRVIRGFINDKTLKLDMRAGMHVHVGAEKVPFHNAYNLHKLYMYMEDFLYRLGAAKWPYHRSVNRRGRDQAGKSPGTSGKLNFAQTFSGQRYYGLSFDNYFARYFESCSCGARSYGLFDECTCDLGKCTFEFRLFNTTANTVKIHAYLAICQSLVAKAIELDEITDEREYPALDFVKAKVPDMHHSTRSKYIREWEKRIVFVNEQLPLTPEEKKSIHYCVMNSELGKVVTNADILLETEEN